MWRAREAGRWGLGTGTARRLRVCHLPCSAQSPDTNRCSPMFWGGAAPKFGFKSFHITVGDGVRTPSPLNAQREAPRRTGQ